MIDLEELEKLAKDATPGPWRIDAENNPAHFIMTNEDIPMHRLIAISESPIATCDLSRRWTESCANAAYIVAACNAVPELIARIRELEERAQKAEDRLGDCRLMQTAYMRTISDLKAELFKRSPSVDFPKLRKSVEHIDNSLSVFLEDSIKRAASRP